MRTRTSALLALPLAISIVTLGACAAEVEPTPGTVGTSGTSEPLDDSRINSAVQSKVFASDGLSRRNIEVMTMDGVVTLTGVVESEEIRTTALKVAAEAEGVTRVNDRMTVDPDWRARAEAAEEAAERAEDAAERAEDAGR